MSQLSPQRFPLEILMDIIDRLLIHDKANLFKVNREWHEYMAANDWVWLKLDTGDMSSDETSDQGFDATSVVFPYLLKTNHSTRQLSIIHKAVNCEWISLGLQLCSELRELRLATVVGGLGPMWDKAYCLPVLRKLELQGDFDISVPVRFLDNCPCLESAHFVFQGPARSDVISMGTISRALKTLKLHGVVVVHANYPAGLIDGALSLEDFEVRGYHSPITSDFRSLAKLKRIYVPLCRGLDNIQVPPSLEELGIGLETMTSSAIVVPMPNLKTLNITYHGTGDMNSFLYSICKVLSSVGDQLTELVLSNTCGSSLASELEASFIHALWDTGKIRKVKNFAIEFNGSIRNPALEATASVFANMENCVLRGKSSEITKDHIHTLVESLPNLKGLRMSWPEFIPPHGEELERYESFYGERQQRRKDMEQWLQDKGITSDPRFDSQDFDMGAFIGDWYNEYADW